MRFHTKLDPLAPRPHGREDLRVSWTDAKGTVWAVDCSRLVLPSAGRVIDATPILVEDRIVEA